MIEKPAVLVVDDDESFRTLVVDRLTRTGHRVAAAAGGEAALELLEGIEVALIDLLMPGMDGLALLRALQSQDADVTTLLLTAMGTVETAVEAMKEGAYDYLTKPVDIQRLKVLLDKIVERTRKGGGEVLNLMGTSAYYAPASSAVSMAKAYLRDERRLLPCAAYLEGEYGYKDLFMGVPCIIGGKGVERIVEIPLTEEEKAMLAKSAKSVQAVVDICKKG